MSIVYSTVTSIFAEAYERYANEVAVVWDETNLTYAELGQQARRLANGLRAAGVAQGDRVAVLTKNRPEFFLIDHALAAGGLIRVALNYRLHPSEVRHVAEDCEPKAVFLDRERAEETAKCLSVLEPRPLLVGLDEETPGVDVHYSELMSDAEIETISVEPEQIAWLPYTSGTTGEPKGVMLSHRSLVACMRNLMVELPPIETDDLVLHVAPLSHMSGYVAMTYFARGAGQVVLPEFKAADTLQAIDEHGATVLPLVPTMLNMLLPLLESKDSDRWSTETLHTVLYAGSAIAPDRLARAVQCLGNVFVQAYGLTEIPFPLSALSKRAHVFDLGGPPPPRLASGGCINPFVQVRLRKPDGTDAALGEEGEIQARCDTTMLGYWNRPVETAEVLAPDGWLSTGDVGRMTDGYLHIVDRKKDMIVSGGFNIFPAEIENAISALRGVHEVAVIGVPDESWGEAVKAVIVVRDGHSVTPADVDRICHERIAAYKRPRSIDIVDALPKTGSGKIQRNELRKTYWGGRDRRVGG